MAITAKVSGRIRRRMVKLVLRKGSRIFLKSIETDLRMTSSTIPAFG